MKWFQLLMANQEDLARIMTAEQVPFGRSQGEVAYGASLMNGLPRKPASTAKPAAVRQQPPPDRYFQAAHRRVPRMPPWNFPLAMITAAVAPAGRSRLHGRHQAGRTSRR
jgi:succinate-semialdehyde dehydrogenase/glutarate-semialdehyde dehydrogenase